jgi:prevent-host-death family protein
MDVAVTQLRANLSEWLARARGGEEVVVTERGDPVARLVGIEATPTLERLTRDGVIARPPAPGRPSATGRPRLPVRRPVADRISDQRG